MKNIKTVTANEDKKSFSDILQRINNPKRDALKKRKKQLDTALEGYQDAILHGTAAPLNTSVVIKGFLHALYDSRAAVVVDMKDALELEYLEHTCPYCQLDKVSHIDHFLPRSKFPEFAVSTQNLLMSCDRCNSIFKHDYWGNGISQKFIHPRYNGLKNHDYLEATVAYKKRTIVVKFKIRSGLPLSGLMKRHFKHMDLNTRYVASSTLSEITKMKNAMFMGNTAARQLKHLREFVEYQVQTTSINTLEHAFYLAVTPLVSVIAAGGLS